jgi:CheY-like chemotaxis protein
MREILRHLLREDAHLVIEATNGAQAFALFLSTKFDLVLTDFEMPFVKGNQLAAKIRRVAPRQPILMLTAFDHPASANNPVDAVVSKPFDSSKLREAIARVFSHPRALAPVPSHGTQPTLNPAAHN